MEEKDIGELFTYYEYFFLVLLTKMLELENETKNVGVFEQVDWGQAESKCAHLVSCCEDLQTALNSMTGMDGLVDPMQIVAREQLKKGAEAYQIYALLLFAVYSGLSKRASGTGKYSFFSYSKDRKRAQQGRSFLTEYVDICSEMFHNLERIIIPE